MSLVKFRSVWATFFLAFVLAFVATSAHAVDVNGRIKGTVTDPSGAVIPAAQVTATNLATGVKYPTKSLATGDYLFPQLPVGTYSITASAPGFKTFAATGIVLNIDQEYVEPVKLTIGNTSETLEVAADAVQVNTSDMQMSNIVDAKQMEELPLINRNFTNLEQTLPGVNLNENRFGGTFSVNGSQAQQSEYMINGADTNDIALNTIVLTPNLDAIDQFNLIDGPLNAEYDRNSGGIVTAAIKQGTNHIHGRAFEFYRDTFLNTNNYLQKQFDASGNRTDAVSPYHQNIFGGTLGGPILRDKLFAFGAYQGTHQRVPETGFAAHNTVLSSADLAGDYSSSLGSFSANPIPATISIPGCTAGEAWADCAAALGGKFKPANFNSISSKLASQYIPAPNNAGNVYQYNATENTTTNQYIGRVDYNINPRNVLTVLGIYQVTNLSEGAPFDGATLPGFGDEDLEHIQQYTLDYIRTISPTTVNDLSAHYTRFNYKAVFPQQIVQPSTAGFAITPQVPSYATLPTVQVGGDVGFTIGGTADGPQPRIDQVIQFDDNLSKTFGRHSLKFGYDGRRFNVSNAFGSRNSGAYAFNGSGAYSTGIASLDYLLGIPDTYTQGTTGEIQADAFLNYIYAQDTWKVSNSLTLDYGLGYSMDTPLRNHQYGGLGVACFSIGQQSTVFPSAPKNMIYPGDPGCTDSAQATMHYNEFGPRFGFAWAPDLGWISGTPGKFSIRGGYGIYYDRTEEEGSLQTQGTPPFGLTSGGALDANGSPSFQNPYADINGVAANSEASPFPYTQPTKGSNIAFPSRIYNIDSFDKSYRAPYSENFQLSIERQLPSQVVARVSYVGALGRHNQTGYEGNYETAAGHAACLADPVCSAVDPNTGDSLRGFRQALDYPSHTIGNSKQLIEMGETGSYSSSNYNALEVSITKAPTHGLLFQLSYTYSHALDDGSSFENLGFGGSGGTSGSGRGYNQWDKALNYGNAAFDQRHHLVFSPVYTSPILHGHSTFSPINLALSGWQISGIMTLASGQPFDVSYGGFTNSNSLWCSYAVSFYACPDIPEQTASYKRINPKTSGLQYFDPSSFASEPVGQFGNIGRDAFRQPGYANTDFIIAKNFNLSADGVRRLQVRMESDNVFNHTNFRTPDGNFSDGTFGQITDAAPSRVSQLGAKLYF
ncbi:MAG TPA: carboxypeptidase regulatory-like domain-containing protein [Bryocella sp.]|nr:carboxypeptidase regulatory-like domain-containing protein [Bryocella sp.]